jgi:hypothetical protein
MAAARFSSDVLSEAIQKCRREKVAKKIRKRKENGWEEVHREMKTVAQNIEESCDFSEALQKLPPELREKILKEYIAIKIKEKNEMGWMDVHEEIENLPYCEIQGQLTKVFVCRKCNTCKLTALCVACYENETCLKCKTCKSTEFCLGCFENKTQYHSLVGREEVGDLERKGFARVWGAPKRISESPQEIKEREEIIRLIRLKRSVDKLSEEYLEQKAEKKKGKRGGRCSQRNEQNMFPA